MTLRKLVYNSNTRIEYNANGTDHLIFLGGILGEGYYDCGYGCQFYAYNPGCSSCTTTTTTYGGSVTTTTTLNPFSVDTVLVDYYDTTTANVKCSWAYNNSMVYKIGICWGTSANPTISDNKFESDISNDYVYSHAASNTWYFTMFPISAGVTYHVRAYVYKDGLGYVYGDDYTYSY